MSKAVEIMELALQIHKLKPQIRPCVALDTISGFIEVEIYEKLELDAVDRIYRSLAMLDDGEAVKALVNDLKVMMKYSKGEGADDVRP